jgi:uncharacterized membrane protein YheB (UPF0754 family)
MSTSQIFIYLTPIVSGLIGWFTNWVAVKMLFKPVKPVNFGIYKLQGVFPKRQDKLAASIGRMVADELLTAHDIRERVLHQDNIDALLEFVENKIEHYLKEDFPVRYPIASIFFGKRRREQIKIDLMNEVHVMAPEVIHKVMEDLEKNMKVEDLVAQKVAALSPDKLENLINGILKKELGFIEWSGAVLGFLVGVIQVLLIELFK